MGEDKVVSLQARREQNSPHLSGSARCVACAHTWVAVAPAGVTILECPRCKRDTGVWCSLVLPPDGVDHWMCNCGGIAFVLMRAGPPLCMGCGSRATGWAQ